MSSVSNTAVKSNESSEAHTSYPKKEQSQSQPGTHSLHIPDSLTINESVITPINQDLSSPLVDDIDEIGDSKAGRIYLFGSDLAGVKQSINRSSKQSTLQSTRQSLNDNSQPANSSIDANHVTDVHAVNQPVHQSTSRLPHQSIDNSDEEILHTPTLLPAFKSLRACSVTLSASHGGIITEDGQLHTFGSNERGELGRSAGPSASKSSNLYVSPPQTVSALSSSFIVQAATGLNHTAVVTSRGTVFVCGADDFGQLGVSSGINMSDFADRSEPVAVKSLNGVNIVKICCGDAHTLALSDGGVVYAAGDAKRGATGLEMGKTWSSERSRVAAFTPVSALVPLPIVDIAVGSNHSIAITAGGAVYSFGASRRGQTGHGTSENVMLPRRIESLKDIRVVRVFASGDTSAALSADGNLYMFGANQHGQLGTGDRDARFAPVRLTDGLEDKIIVKVALGLNHMLVLCDDHSVFGCGDSALGQLGLGDLDDSNAVAQDFKRQKTGDVELALVPASGKLSVDIANGRGDVLIPVQIPLSRGRMVIDVAAGGTSSAVILSCHSAVLPLPSIAIPSSHQSIKRIIPDSFNALVESCRSEGSFVPLILYINKHFASVQSLNASFLPAAVSTPMAPFDQVRLMRQASLTNQVDDPLALAIVTPAALLFESGRRNPLTSAVPGSIDVLAVEEVYKTILRESVTEPKLTAALSHGMQKCIHELLTRLKSTHPPSESEAYRCLAICLQSPLFSQAAASNLELLSDIAQCLDRLSITCRKSLRRWWSAYPSDVFGARLVRSTVHAVHTHLTESKQHNVEQRSDGVVILQARLRRVSDQVQMLIKMLDLMHQASELAAPGGLLEAKHFHIPIGDLIALDEDFFAFVRTPAEASQLPAFSFLRYPFVLDAATKAAYMHIEHMYHQRHSMMQALAFEQQPYTILKIKRESLVESTIYQLNSFRTDELQRPIKVEFIGESGVDHGGLSTEWFRLVLKELMSSAYQLFDYDEERRQLWYNLSDVTDNPSKLDLYYITGLLIGLAIVNVVALEGVNFPLALYKSLLHSSKQSITYTLEDLLSLDPQLTRSLQHILSYEGNDMEEVFDLTFTTSHPVHKENNEIEIQTVELTPNGAHVMVTQANKQQYVHAVIQQHLYGSVKAQTQAFLKGFRSVCGGRVLTLFTPSDLERMCVGTPVLDFSLLKTRARYEGFRAESPIVQWLWEILQDMSLEEKQRFLTFVTGSSRIGIGGLSSMIITIQRAGPDSESWPTASTCFSILLINEYSSQDKLKSKLLAAIQHTEGFGLQ